MCLLAESEWETQRLLKSFVLLVHCSHQLRHQLKALVVEVKG